MPVERERLLAAARAVGDRLETLALHGEHGVNWIGLTITGQWHYRLDRLGPDLYDGLPGVILFLAYLGAVTQEPPYTGLAQAALTTLQRQLEPNGPTLQWIGAFVGWGGVIYALTHLGVLWDRPSLLVQAEEIVSRLPALIEQDRYYDVIFGAAGCIGGLLCLHRCAPAKRTLAAVQQCGHRLVSGAQPMEQGRGWITPAGRGQPLTGFSHGAAGIAWALLELAARTGQECFRQGRARPSLMSAASSRPRRATGRIYAISQTATRTIL